MTLEQQAEEAKCGVRESLTHICDYIDENRTKIDVLKSLTQTEDVLSKIRNAYQDNMALAVAYYVEPECLYEYAEFLGGIGEFEEAIKIAERLEHWYAILEVCDVRYASLKELQGDLFSSILDNESAHYAYLDALDVYRYEQDFKRITAVCNKLYIILTAMEWPERAERFYLEGVDAQQQLEM